jgi:hypothetical protein
MTRIAIRNFIVARRVNGASCGFHQGNSSFVCACFKDILLIYAIIVPQDIKPAKEM